MRARIWLLAAAAALACVFLGAASAPAAHAPKPTLHPPGGVMKRNLRAGSNAGHAPSGHVVNPTQPVTFHGGPVMTTENVFLIFWHVPGGQAFPSGYEAAVQKWVQDLAADDGKSSSPFGAIAQYHAAYNVHLGGSADDSAAPDTPNDQNNPCDLQGNNPPPCVNEQSIVDEIESVREAQGWPAGGLSTQFALIMPPGVGTCDITDACSDIVFCAYHTFYTFTNSSTPFIFLTLPFEDPFGCHSTDGQHPQPEPNGQPDVLFGAMSHEMREAATDPELNAWFDNLGNEADDKCFDEYGSNIGTTTGNVQFNQLINGTGYDTQLEWSNALMGCYQVGPPTVTSFSPGTGLAGTTVTVNGTNFFAPVGTKPQVTFNGLVSPTVTVISPTQMTAVVPAGNVQGKVSVTALGGQGTSTQSLTQAPTVSSLSETVGHAGDVVTINGLAFASVRSVTFGGVAATFGSVATNGTSLKATVPTAAVDGDVTVTTAAGSASGPTGFTVLPTITSFTPTSGIAGTSLTINGSGFGALNGVTFTDAHGDADGIPVSSSATQIVVGIPSGAELGPFTVHTHVGQTNATSATPFKPLLSVSDLSGSSVKPGDTVIVGGANFLADGPVSVTVNGVTACNSCSATPTRVTFTVPNTVSGPVTVSNADGSASLPISVLPRIDSMSISGGVVTLRGAAFAGTTAVTFGDGAEPARFSIGAGGTTLSVTVPASATTGHIAVTNAGGTTRSSGTFTVPPVLTSFAPTSATVGQTIGITGTGLSGADRVDFTGGVSATPTVLSSSSLQVVVPAGAQTGPISVHTSSGTAASSRPLTISFSVARFAPNHADYGATITITGSALTGTTAVLFNGVPGTNVTVVDDGHVTVRVPASGSLTGPITVVNGGVSVRAPGLFTLFGIHSVSPNAGPAGTTVVITGVGFSGATRVRFSGGVDGTFTVNSDTQITVVVPAGAANGSITVFIPGATASIAYSVT